MERIYTEKQLRAICKKYQEIIEILSDDIYFEPVEDETEPTYRCSDCLLLWRKDYVLRHIKPNDPDYVRCIKCAEKFDKAAREAVQRDEQDELQGRHECYVCGVEQSFKSFKKLDPMNSANNRCWGCVDETDDIDLPSAENSE